MSQQVFARRCSHAVWNLLVVVKFVVAIRRFAWGSSHTRPEHEARHGKSAMLSRTLELCQQLIISLRNVKQLQRRCVGTVLVHSKLSRAVVPRTMAKFLRSSACTTDGAKHERLTKTPSSVVYSMRLRVSKQRNVRCTYICDIHALSEASRPFLSSVYKNSTLKSGTAC